MSRSSYKPPYTYPGLLNLKKKEKTRSLRFKFVQFIKRFKTKSRSSAILPQLIGKYCEIHSGNKYASFQISQQMVGHRLGEFSQTRKKYVYKRKTKKQNRR